MFDSLSNLQCSSCFYTQKKVEEIPNKIIYTSGLTLRTKKNPIQLSYTQRPLRSGVDRSSRTH